MLSPVETSHWTYNSLLIEIPRLARNDNIPNTLCHAELAEAYLLYLLLVINENLKTTGIAISNGIKAWPDNGSGVERGGGSSKRYHMSHAAGVANCIAWQFHPRGTHRVGLFSLDLLWFFLVSRQERTCESLFAKPFRCDATFQCCSLEYVLRASLYI